MNTFEDIPEETIEQLQQEMETLGFSIGLGNYAYTPVNEELTSWNCSDGNEIKTTLKKLIDKYCDDWFLKEVLLRISKQDWDKLLFDANISQEQYETLFLK